MLTIQASDGGLVNWSNYDDIYIVPVGSDPDQVYSLAAIKNNGDSHSKSVLLSGSETDCQEALGLITEALMSHHWFVSLVPQQPEPDPPEYPGPLTDGKQDGFELYPEPPF